MPEEKGMPKRHVCKEWKSVQEMPHPTPVWFFKLQITDAKERVRGDQTNNYFKISS